MKEFTFSLDMLTKTWPDNFSPLERRQLPKCHQNLYHKITENKDYITVVREQLRVLIQRWGK